MPLTQKTKESGSRILALRLFFEQLQQFFPPNLISFFAAMSYWEVNNVSNICTKALLPRL
jgi:hypothetical protein